jgi:pimeloyl-ACP methyl ester carboxylesterase
MPLAASRSLRLLCVNRRGYQGSTPYSTEELKALTDGTESERADTLAQQGINYAFCINGLIETCGLSEKDCCGVALVVYSMGNAFLMSLLASITSLPVEIRERLRTYIKTIIMLGSLPSPPL